MMMFVVLIMVYLILISSLCYMDFGIKGVCGFWMVLVLYAVLIIADMF